MAVIPDHSQDPNSVGKLQREELATSVGVNKRAEPGILTLPARVTCSTIMQLTRLCAQILKQSAITSPAAKAVSAGSG